jgi:hypothetical protein
VKRAEVAFEQELTERFFARVRRGPPPARLINQYVSARVARSSAKTSGVLLRKDDFRIRSALVARLCLDQPPCALDLKVGDTLSSGAADAFDAHQVPLRRAKRVYQKAQACQRSIRMHEAGDGWRRAYRAGAGPVEGLKTRCIDQPSKAGPVHLQRSKGKTACSALRFADLQE